jgi:hypothetical protein
VSLPSAGSFATCNAAGAARAARTDYRYRRARGELGVLFFGVEPEQPFRNWVDLRAYFSSGAAPATSRGLPFWTVLGAPQPPLTLPIWGADTKLDAVGADPEKVTELIAQRQTGVLDVVQQIGNSII